MEQLPSPSGTPVARDDALSLTAPPWVQFAGEDTIAAWDALAHAASEPNPFYESWYLLPSLRALDPAGAVVLLVLRAQGELVGLLPVRREPRYYGHRLPHWRNWVHANCFAGHPLVARGYERAFWNAALDWFDHRSGSALFLHLAQCPLGGPLHHALREELAARPRRAATVLCEERALLETTLAPEDYLVASLSGKKRKELRRQHRRLAEEGTLDITRHHDATGVRDWAEAFLALERRGWKGAAGSALACDRRTTALFVEALEGAAQRGRLERLALRLDGRPIAMLASFLAPPGAFSYKTAFDEDYARFSPGVLLQAENLALIERPDLAWVDSCAAQDHPMIDHFWRERRAIACHSIAIGGALRRALFGALLRREKSATHGGIA